MTAKRSSFLNRRSSTLFSLRNILLLLPLLFLAGCGDVEWFPEYEREPTTPDAFTFISEKGVELGDSVTSEAVTVSGIEAGSAPISISGPEGSNSKYSINGEEPTDARGNVSNGDKVTVSHTASTDVGETTTSTLTIGNVSGTFSSTTQTVSLKWRAPTDNGTYRQVIAEVTAKDNVSGGHVISIKDSRNTNYPSYAVTEINGDPTFRSDEATFYTLNNRWIYVKNLQSNDATTTLTIDDIDFTVDLSH